MSYEEQLKKQQNTTEFNDNEADKYYKNLQDQTYSALLNEQVMANAAKQNALKYTNNMMARSGYGSQGVSESTGLGIENSYRNAMNTAMQNYNSTMDKGYADALKTATENIGANYESLASSIAQDGITKEQLIDTMKNYGVDYNADTNSFDIDNTKYNDTQKAELKTYLDSMKNVLNGTATNDNNQVVRSANAVRDENNITTTRTSTGAEIKSNLNTSSTNKNFSIEVNGKAYEFELGAKVGNYGKNISGLSNAEAEMQFRDKAIGEIWTYTSKNDKRLVLMTKAPDGSIRLIEGVGKNKPSTNEKSLKAVLEALGVDLSDREYKYNFLTGRNNYTKK